MGTAKTNREEILQVLKEYLAATYSQDYKRMYELLYEDDVTEYKKKFLEVALKIDEFGENEDLLKKLNVESLEELEKMSDKVFMTSLFKLMTREVGEKTMKKILKGLTITSIDEVDYLSIVQYQFPIKIFDEWEEYESELQMIKTDGDWKILFKTQLNPFERYESEIDRYNLRKKSDNLENYKFEGDLTPFSIIGYKDFGTDKIVFEPRFRDAGEFHDGLAYVQIFRKYGYINLKGEIAIKPSYHRTNDFSQKIASVAIQDENDQIKWGFINRKGKYLIEPKYIGAKNFGQGLCAVKLDDKWGYINKKDEVVIPFKFHSADKFEHGFAFVEVHNSKKELKGLKIDKKGNIIDLGY